MTDEELTCWCGATGTYAELFDNTYLDSRCGGTGILHCECGGDLCVCHNHGETDCMGCEDCDSDEDDLVDAEEHWEEYDEDFAP